MEIDPLYLEAIEELENERELAQQPIFFPYLDKSCCWNPNEFFKENMLAIKEGYFGPKLEDRLCSWLGHGRMGLLYEKNGLYLAIRCLDQEKGIYWRILNIRHLPFDITVYVHHMKFFTSYDAHPSLLGLGCTQNQRGNYFRKSSSRKEITKST